MAASLLTSFTAAAQFPRNESFTGGSAPGFTFGGSGTNKSGSPNTATLTGGYLRLTDDAQQTTGFAVDSRDNAFPTSQGFSISFEFFSYGGTGADGFSMFLFDGETTNFTIGGAGGSLGYANYSYNGLTSAGATNGYLGIGFDEFGNFVTNNDGRKGTSSSLIPNSVTVRGKSANGYDLLANSGTLSPALSVATTRAQAGSADYRRAFVDVKPANGSYLVTVRVQRGSTVSTVINQLQAPAGIPGSLRIGFAAATGQSTNFHEIRGLSVVLPTQANDDIASTPYSVPVTLNLLGNDFAPGSSLDPATVDLDPTTVDPDNTVTNAQGTFTVNTSGVLTFTPNSTFAGMASIPYTVRDILGTLSNQATATVEVRGADVATAVTGPVSALPGARLTYTVTTYNAGPEPGVQVVPTLTLVPNLPASSLTLPAGAQYNGTTGVLTLASIANLPAGTGTSSQLTLTAPTTGTIKGITDYSASSADGNPANDGNSLTTTIMGMANAPAVCALPGQDGPVALSGSSRANTYYPAQTSASAGRTQLTLGPAFVGAGAASTPISAGDLLLIIQMQGADISTSNDDLRYGSGQGDGTSSGSGNGMLGTNLTAGRYEYAVAASDVPLSGGPLTLTQGLTNGYLRQEPSGPAGRQRYQVVRVPQYASATVTGTVTGTAWNGETGGVLTLDVAGTIKFNANSQLDMSGKGFRGGYSLPGATFNLAANSFRNGAGNNGTKGEGVAGTPRYTASYASNGATAEQNTNTTFGYTDGDNGQGGPANAGGGGSDPSSTAVGNAGGGGGGNAGAGGQGGSVNNNTIQTTQRGAVGGAVFSSMAPFLVMGGGGGAGTTPQPSPSSSGGSGGGIIIVRAYSFDATAGSAYVRAKGYNGATSGDNSGGGGGGGGSIVLLAASTTNPGINSLANVEVGGGVGGNAAQSHGPGGGGGGGIILSNATLGTTTIGSGAAGTTSLLLNATLVSTNASAAAGTNGTRTSNASLVTNVQGGAGNCLPTLSVALRTTTPTVGRSTNGTVAPANFVLTISNTGGPISGATATVLPNSPFFTFDGSFTPTYSLTGPDGKVLATNRTTALNITGPANGDNPMIFSGIDIPAGYTLTATFRDKVANAIPNNSVTEADAVVNFLDPTRTTTTGATTPGQNLAAGYATPGLNYALASSPAENVTVAPAPLPVELRYFEVAASGRDSRLSWATAAELHSDRFEVQRSLDGVQFSAIGSRPGLGSSALGTTYSWLDREAAALGAVVYYRLRQVDADGTSSFSLVKAVAFSPTGTTPDVQLFPNPATDRVTLDLLSLPAAPVTVTISDLAGRTVQRLQVLGGQQPDVSLSGLAAGTYLVRVQAAGGYQTVRRLTHE